MSWVHELERTKLRQLLQQKRAILLTGHIHEGTADTSGLTQTQLLQLGVGAAYGEKWLGRNHCRILEFDTNQEGVLLHDWIWFGEWGWRAFEPLEAQCAGWQKNRKSFLRTSHIDSHAINKKAMEAGLTDICNGRKDSDRLEYYNHVLDCAEPNSDLIIVGRSLKDWANRKKSLQMAINQKNIHVKLGLLDENSILNNAYHSKTEKNTSWIEKPIYDDWAIDDVPNSMNIFRSIKLEENCQGTLEIYGLPFYVTHSFVAYTNQYDKNRYCAEEAGMALNEHERPFLEVSRISSLSYSWASGIENIYISMLTPDRMLLSISGNQREEHDTTERSKIIQPKIKKLGLVDLAINREKIDWSNHGIRDVISCSPDRGEIFIVARSIVSLFNHMVDKDLIDAIRKKNLRCNLVIADPTMGNLTSLVGHDYAPIDLKQKIDAFKFSQLKSALPINTDPEAGYLEIFGIPAYVPVSFASYCWEKNGEIIRYCTLEPGIAVVPEDRPFFCFRETSKPKTPKIGSVDPNDYDGNDVYNKLNKIYRQIIYDGTIDERTKLLFSSKREFEKILKPITGNTMKQEIEYGDRGWFIGHFIDQSRELCRTHDVEIKWGTHKAGEARKNPGFSKFATTITLLIEGSFLINFPGNNQDTITLKDKGDYVVYPPGTRHTWKALSDCVVVTVRWPSCKDYVE